MSPYYQQHFSPGEYYSLGYTPWVVQCAATGLAAEVKHKPRGLTEGSSGGRAWQILLVTLRMPFTQETMVQHACILRGGTVAWQISLATLCRFIQVTWDLNELKEVAGNILLAN